MKNINEKIIDWVVNKIKDAYPEDIAMLLVYGSYVNSTSNALSDVDFYFIPKTDRGLKMSQTFIIGGIGYDLFPMSWERVDGIAEFKQPLTPLVGNVRIAYYASDQDLARFEQIQAKLSKNLSDEKFMRDIAVKNLEKAMSKYTKLLLSSQEKTTRAVSGEILLLLSDAVAYMNQTYFKKGLKNQLQDLEAMKLMPDGYIELYKQVVAAKTFEQISKYTIQMIKETSQMIENTGIVDHKTKSTDFQEIKGAYEELLSTWNKVKICCAQGNKELAFISGVNLQGVLDWLNEDYTFPEYDLMGSFDADDLEAFDQKAEAIRLEVVSFLKANAVEVIDYETFEVFSDKVGDNNV